MSRALGVAENLRRRNININPYCARCCVELESTDHTFFSCPQAEAVWRGTHIPTHLLCDPTKTFEDKLRYIFELHKDTQIEQSLRFLPF